MGNTPNVEYPVGAVVDARYDGNQTTYYRATIIKKHEYGRYDVKFSNGTKKTIFWDDIKPNSIGTPVVSNKASAADVASKENPAQNAKKYNEVSDDQKPFKTLDLSLNTAVGDKVWNELTENIGFLVKNDQNIKLNLSTTKKSEAFDIENLEKMEKLLNVIGGEELCKNVILSNNEKSSKQMIEYIQNAAKNSQTKYVKALKSINILQREVAEKTNVFDKYAMRYKIAMDLDFDEIVTKNEQFGDEMVLELASILNVHPSLINLECAVKGSVIVTVGICAFAFVAMIFGFLSAQKLTYLIERKVQRKQSDGEMLLGLGIGDEVLVDWNEQQYEAKVIEKFQTENINEVKVEYKGKPFMFQNTEKLELSSPRLHIKEPGYRYEASFYPEKEVIMSTLYKHLIRRCSHATNNQSKQIFSKEFEELCYKHLLVGQHKQQSCRNFIFDQEYSSNWKISLPEQTFTLHSDIDTAFKIPLQLFGTYSKQNKSFLFADCNKELMNEYPETISNTLELKKKYSQIPEFQQTIIENCNENLPYIMLSLMICSMDNINGYYVGSFPYDTKQPILFILMDELSKHTDYNEEEFINTDMSELINTWDFTFNFMVKECGIELPDNIRIFEEFFAHFKIGCKREENVIITEFDSGKAISVTRLSMEKNMFNLNNIDFDSNLDVRRLNGMDFRVKSESDDGGQQSGGGYSLKYH